MEGAERDTTEDWLLPESRVPPRLGELELRVDEALAIARSSEAAVNVVGEAALDAAKQARRAAELAESASAVALDASLAVRSAIARPAIAGPVPPGPGTGPAEERIDEEDLMRRFNERADRVMTRLRQLERAF